MKNIEHPDITSAQRTGYPVHAAQENKDTQEARKDFIEEHSLDLIRWLRMGYPDILNEFISMSGQACSISYKNWLN